MVKLNKYQAQMVTEVLCKHFLTKVFPPLDGEVSPLSVLSELLATVSFVSSKAKLATSAVLSFLERNLVSQQGAKHLKLDFLIKKEHFL